MTLLEIMIALLLLGVLSTFVVNVVDSVVGLWQQGERRGRGDLVYASVAERFQSDLRSLHLGERGWIIIDDYIARAATDDEGEWRLPRLRFLATGSGLSADDPSKTHAVEVMWLLVPEGAVGHRFTRLVRVAQLENDAQSLRQSNVARAAVNGSNATTIVDGVLALKFEHGNRGNLVVDPYSNINFPAHLNLRLERVSGNARLKPPRLDAAVDSENASVLLRGQAPTVLPDFALIGNEWVAVAGMFPRINFSARGQRNTIASNHAASSFVFFPTVYESRHPVLNLGKRSVR
jgi:hypothetical protein